MKLIAKIKRNKKSISILFLFPVIVLFKAVLHPSERISHGQETQEKMQRTAGALDSSFFPFLERDDRISCDSITRMLSEDGLHPSKVNAIRRKLMLSDRSCFERHIERFGELFLSRFSEKHVMLHIPKCGGTSICERVIEENSLANPGGNCWKEDFCPYWCGCTDPKPTTCDQLKGWYADFVMNENWLDSFCAHHTYSILLRDPISRTMSHVNHFLNAVASRHDDFYEAKNWRLSLIQFNYMTWAMSASDEIDKNLSNRFTPDEGHLKIAMKRLMEMDYLIDLSHQNKICRDYLFKNAIKISSPIGHANSDGSNYGDDFSHDSFEAMNSLDIELYKFATKLIDVDCLFIATMLDMKTS
jgi:hypothetical protein